MFDDVLTQMREQGLVVEAIDASGAIVKVPVCEPRPDKGSKKSGWYVAHEIRLKSGERTLAGWFGNYKLSGDAKFKIGRQGRGWSEEDRREYERARRETQARVKAEREKQVAECKARAAKIWAALPETGPSPYLDQKRVGAFGTRFTRGKVVVPLYHATGQGLELVGLQFISEDGSKRFLTGTPKQGAFHVIGEVRAGEPVIAVEGYATGASVHVATGLPVVVAFDAGNLEPVARAVKATFAPSLICIAGDNDTETAGNPGLTKAQTAARAVGGVCVVPEFPGASHAA